MNSVKKAIKENKFINRKVFENYFFMTLLQVVSPLIGFIVYPYIITVLGPSNYGLYVVSLSITTYFAIIISYGFSWTGLRDISCYHDNQEEKDKIFSTIFIAKSLLLIVVFTFFCLLISFIPFCKQNKFILLFSCLQVVVPEMLFPCWFFQGIQKMKVVTIVQLFSRLLTIPLIFVLIKKQGDILIYAMITSGTTILGSFISAWFIFCKEKIRISMVSFEKLTMCFKEAFPFFCTNIAHSAKTELLPIITGAFLGLYDVALYDLARKIISIPTVLTDKINGALFPEIIRNPIRSKIKKIMNMEVLIGIVAVFLVCALSYWLILFLGGEQMTGAYPLTCILSITILTNLLVEAYMNFVFVPSKKYYYITQLQIVSLVFIVIFSLSLLIFKPSIFVIAITASLSSIVEVAYAYFRIKQRRLL